MALRHAVLAALLDGEASGYELSKWFAAGVANYWSATSQQVYRELEQLQTDGMIEARVVEQERRPNKRMFSLTPAGEAELHAFTQQPGRPLALRDDLIVKLRAVDVGDIDAVLDAVAARRDEASAKLEHFERYRDHLLGELSHEEFLRASDRIGPYLTVMGGVMLERLYIDWMTQLTEILERRRDSP